MTTPPEAGEDRDSDAAPYLPPSLPAAPIAAVTAAAATAAAIGQPGADAPFVPMPTPVAAPPAAEPVFDAKAMVDSQKGFNAKPAYGAMPTGTEASRDAAKQLRAKGQKKRRRNLRTLFLPEPFAPFQNCCPMRCVTLNQMVKPCS